MSQLTISPISAFDDNYIWCIQNNSDCVVVDPGDAAPVLEHCQSHKLTLSAILITHHHWDHTNGLDALLAEFPGIPVFGPQVGNIRFLTHKLKEGDEITLAQFNMTLRILDVPGHTLDHIAYVSDLGVFCGDTLFSGGCGRLFEGTPEQMNRSLGKLMLLDDELAVYCTHEYTLANLKFANTVEPENNALKDYTQWAIKQRALGQPTLPSTIKREKAINPFLRTQEQRIKHNVEQQLGQSLQGSDDVFAAIRGWKDHF